MSYVHKFSGDLKSHKSCHKDLIWSKHHSKDQDNTRVLKDRVRSMRWLMGSKLFESLFLVSSHAPLQVHILNTHSRRSLSENTSLGHPHHSGHPQEPNGVYKSQKCQVNVLSSLGGQVLKFWFHVCLCKKRCFLGFLIIFGKKGLKRCKGSKRWQRLCTRCFYMHKSGI